MFKATEVSFEPSGFQSCWKAKSEKAENQTQSEPLKTDEREAQTIGHDDKECQTDPEKEVTVAAADAAVQPSLVAFLTRAAPVMLQVLERASKSRAFDGYRLIEDEDDSPVRRLFTLRLGKRTDLSSKLQVSALSWSSTGSVIAVGYGAEEHESWCEHPTDLALWNVNRKDMDVNQPYRRLELRSCVSCLSFHPAEPSRLAVALVTGEMQLYDLSRDDDPFLGSTAGVISGHREPISALYWVSRSAGYMLVSAARDGRLLVWKFSEAKQQLQLNKKFQLMADQLPRAGGRRPGRADSEAGLTAIAFSHDNYDQFLLGSEGGGIFLCSFASEVPAAVALSGGDRDLVNPVTSTFEPHSGEVLMLQCSKFHRNIFISAGSDNEVRVWNTLQISALLSISLDVAVTGAALSPSRPLVLFVTTAAGEQHLYDITRRATPLHSIKVHEKAVPVTALKLNDKDVHLLATGDSQGAAQIWSLATEYVSPKPHELAELNRLGNVGTEA